MKVKANLLGITFLLSLCSLGWVSCNNDDDIDLINPFHKTLDVSCGYDFEVPVQSSNWRIEYVQEISTGENILDKDGNPLTLNGKGKVEAADGWLSLTRKEEDRFTINLKENFDPSKERKLKICINEAGRRDYVTVIQRAGKYELIKATYQEIEEQRDVYISEEGCSTIALTNNSSEEIWKPCEYIFEDVVSSSEFQSDDYGAFDWVAKEGFELSMPELIIDGFIRWDGFCSYEKGITTTPLIKDIPNGSKILVPPHSTIYLKGEITYCKRVCNYTFTVKNTNSGTQFEVNGVWTQVVPISKNTISFDKDAKAVR